MGTSLRRALGSGLTVLCALALAGVAQPLAASAAPTTAPTPGAAQTSYSRSDADFAVTVSPARLMVSPQERQSDHLVTVVNRGQQPVALDVEKRNFVAGADGGLSYRPDAPYGAADWVRLSATKLTLEPGTSQQVTATIDMPSDPEPGDHQVALVFLAPAAKGEGNIRVNRGIGTPVYVTVPGPTDDSVRLNALTGPGWSLRGDPVLTTSMSSTGTVHRDFRGPAALPVGTPGHLSRYSDFTVSRGADRVVSTTWDAPLFCVCHPIVTVTNAGQAPQTLTTRVVVLPWWSLAGLLLVVGAATALLLRSRRRSRRPGGTTGDAVPAGESG